jgi:hypothetical protein
LGDDDSGCTTTDYTDCPSAPGTHSVATGSQPDCILQCEDGWSDCDGDPTDGCETAGACPVSAPDGGDGGSSPELVAALSGLPRGLVACGDAGVYYFDDHALELVIGDAGAVRVLTTVETPAGGVACDGQNVYWATSSSGDAAPNGAIWSTPLGHELPVAVATGVDPGRGIDVRGPGICWLAREFGDAGPSLVGTVPGSGSVAELPGSDTGAYKSFALLRYADYSIAAGRVLTDALPIDAGSRVVTDLGFTMATSLVATTTELFVVTAADPGPPVDAGADATLDGSSDAPDSLDAGDEAAEDAGIAAEDAGVDAAEDAGVEDAGVDAAEVEDATLADANVEGGPDASGDAIDDAPAEASASWVLRADGSVLAGRLPPVVATAASRALVAASDDQVFSIDLDGGAVHTLVQGASHVAYVAADDRFAYFITWSGAADAGALWRVPLP